MQVFKIPEALERKFFILLLCLLAISIPFKPGFNSVLCGLLLVYWILFMKKKFTVIRIGRIVLISTLFWIALVGLLNTENFGEAWFRIQQKLLLLVIPLVVGTATLRWQNDFQIIFGSLLAIIGIVCLAALTKAFYTLIIFDSAVFFFGDGLASAIKLYPYIFSLLCLILIILLAEIAHTKNFLQRNSRTINLIIGLIMFFSIFIILLSVKQIISAWIVLSVILTFRIFTVRQALPILTGGTILVVLAIVFVPALQQKWQEVVTFNEETIPLDQDASLGRDWNGIAIRKAIWNCSIDVVKDNLWLGVGTGDAQDALQQAYHTRQFYFASRYNRFNAHNQYLQVLVAHGLTGFLCWVISIAGLLYYHKTNWCTLAILGCLLVSMLTESIFETNKGILLMAFIFVVISYWEKPAEPMSAVETMS